MTCQIAGCARPSNGLPYCRLCYFYYRSVDDHGYIRFTDQVHLTPTCWNWTGVVKSGYGLFRTPSGAVVMAHRASYEHYVAPIPRDHNIDHLCSNSVCVNPRHLEPVTQSENIQRMYLRRTK